MSVPRPLVDAHARAKLDAIDLPITVASTVRDRDQRLLDFRLEYANVAAHAWAGLEPGSMVGRLVTDIIPGLRAAGLYDVLVDVVTTGRRFRQDGQPYEGNVEEGRTFAAVFDLLAIRHGDGYFSIWAERAHDAPPRDLAAIAETAMRQVPLARLEANAQPGLRLRPAT